MILKTYSSMRKSKAVSRNVVIAIVAIIVIVGVAVAILQFTSAPPSVSGKTWTINVWIGVDKSVGGSNPQNWGRYLIVQVPSNATIKVGDTVQVIFHNNDTFPNPHVLAVAVGSNVITTISAPALSVATITIKVSQAGTYALNCQVYCGAFHLDVGKMQQVTLFTAS
jgi:hypothetical protein